MDQTTEAVLFFVLDAEASKYFGETEHDVLFDWCVRSIRHFSPSSKITLLTNETTSIGDRYPDIDCIRSAVRTDWLMYERSRLYKEHVERRCTEGSSLNLAFLDTDVLVTRDVAPIFDLPFDVGLTTRVTPGIVLDERGVHDDTKANSPINGGVIFARPNQAAAAFFREHMAIYDDLADTGNLKFLEVIKDIRKWGGDQHALMAMVGKTLVKTQPSKMQYKETLVRFFECETHNFSPDINSAVTHEQLRTKYVVHMKGIRKKFMPAVAHMLKIP